MSAANGPVVRIYTRPECHLCHEARDWLERLRGEYPGLVVDEVDIESDDRLHAAYLERIPVIEIDRQVICEIFLEPDAIRVALEAGRVR